MQRMRPRPELRFLPNLLSVSRLFLAALFVPADREARGVLIAVAALTDFLDGWIARRANITSRWGALIDPIADRVFVLVAVSTFLFNGALSTTGYFVMIARDLMTAVGFVVARTISWLRPVQFQARLAGKIVTVLQLLTLFLLVLSPERVGPLLVVVAVTSAWAIVDYTVTLWRMRAQ